MAKKTTKVFEDYGLLRVATAIPTVKVADVEYNLKQHIQLIREAHEEGAQLLAFPELSLTGYTCADLFDNVFVSHEMHLAKPEPEIYHAAVRQIGRPAAQCLFIDDSLLNVEGAQREGLQGAWLDLTKESIGELIRRVVS